MKRFRFVNASERRNEDGIECESFRVKEFKYRVRVGL